MASRRQTLRYAGAALAGIPLAACTAEPNEEAEPDTGSAPANEPAPTTAATALGEPEVVASGLEAPWSIAFHEGTPLVSERDSARVLELDAQGEAREVAVVDGVAGGGEGGLLGLAVRDGFLYAYFTASDGNRIERFALEGAAGALTLGAPQAILSGIPSAGNHNGGRIAFGPDGMLYATAGDAGNPENAQDRESPAGKILRMNPDGTAPDDNPFPGSLVYTWGHRNPQGIAWDEEGGMWAAEFGQDTWDELNRIEPGANYGWPEAEGIAGIGDYTDPVQQWGTDDASPSGMAIAGGTAYIANLRGRRLRAVPLGDPGTSVEHYVEEYGRLRDVVNAPDGSLWVLTNNTDGRGDPGPDDDRVLRIALT
ncbi:PQQ-dependent sugar dehydrogenase [Glycomyces algeriensis]|uniref:Oxidoreductase n=1 Tax=Glycomyces algeriensis TaxID=256037 RepID=A0A9W6GA37_9ACTN|nr:PQQ-dependent sugar dehydrogenase [Glycomyces algeriensis]MDA1364409.1 PQQ-dependent sugar dehydrogenase [Glycomyces algeriensis]MDR7350442.1 glucose/arabinose dehydrogenase [Glycomyces algeriensis]GLI43150.1 oxidoreductase [Glycomyces algeriensis]